MANPFANWTKEMVAEHNHRVSERVPSTQGVKWGGAPNRIEPTKRVKRIRQDPKPLMNRLEQSWFNALSAQFPNYPRPRAQAKRYKIANGSWYRPDVTASLWPDPDGPARETAWECKGPKQMKNVARGMLTIKTAAHQWPEVRFVLVWKDKGQWQTQEVLS